MHNWQDIVREKLVRAEFANGGLARAQRDDVIRELAAHLEETYAQARSEGLPDDAALEHTLQEVQDWPALAADICRAKPQEDDMNHRTKTVWLPGIATSFAAGLLLMFLDRSFFLQQLMWIAGLAMLFCAIASESNRLSPRTKSFWLPGFVAMTAAGLFLLAADLVYDPSFFFTQISLHPQDLFRLHSGAARSFYFSWLFAQVAFGGLGAFFSGRAGGSRSTRIAAGAFPALMMFGLCAVAVPVGFFIQRKATIAPDPADLALGIFVWGVAPAITLLLGALPFLREQNHLARRQA